MDGPSDAAAARTGDNDPLELSVIVLNYNGAQWLRRCLESLAAQSLFRRLEVIVADNASPDGSLQVAQDILASWSNGRVIQHGQNLGFAEGNNRAAHAARGDFLFFLNNDTWLEPDCLERLLEMTRRGGAAAATPEVLDYDTDAFQSLGAGGFDVFGFPTDRRRWAEPVELLMPEGCGYLIRRVEFERLGGFDAQFFMYAEELDLSWRLWIAGGKAIGVPGARLHHVGSAQVGSSAAGWRTSDSKRYYANRNALLVMLKNGRDLLLLAACLQVCWLLFEALIALVVVRRWSHVRRAYLEALRDV